MNTIDARVLSSSELEQVAGGRKFQGYEVCKDGLMVGTCPEDEPTVFDFIQIWAGNMKRLHAALGGKPA
jgi:hypothetical protein